MQTNEKAIVLGLIILVGIAMFYAFTTPKVVPKNNDTTKELELLRKGMAFGENAGDYVYSYNESVDGYQTRYYLVKSANQSTIKVDSPLSSKTAYFLDNDTILCITYPVNQTCTSLNNTEDAKMVSYLNSLKASFFSQGQVTRNKADADYLIENGYLTIEPGMNSRQINGHQCYEITYQLNYTSMPISDAVRFGIGPTTPKIFAWKMCVENSTGSVYSKYFNYTNANVLHEYWFELKEYRKTSTQIDYPQVELADQAPIVIRDEKWHQAQLVDCYLNRRGDERDTCIGNKALELKRMDMCQLAGARSDRCLVSLVPVLKNESICTIIALPSYKDDCQIELAGAYKNSTYCRNLINQSKNAFCLEVATPFVPSTNTTINQTTTQNTTQNSSNRTITDADRNAMDILGRTEVNEGDSQVISNYTAQNSSGSG
ncbi:MAG: hypothetical protein ACP5N9_02645 [Candidatus Bilamarchaeum sp.]|jgi:hypothetical protein